MVSSAGSPANSIDLCLLGSLSVTVDGMPVGLGGPRQMAVLVRLMLTPGQVVSMDQLVDSVWDGDEPAQPNVTIRSYVSNLRRAVEPFRRRRASDSMLASVQPGYLLAVDPTAVDWVRFERLVEDGRAQLTGGDPEAAIERLGAADGLWRGEPCAGVPESQTFLAHRARMIKLREAAVELRFEAMLLRGDYAYVVNEVDGAIEEHPLRERLTELGMIAFYRAGRQSDALGLGRKLRSRLRDELGIDPSPAIEALELKILNHDRSLAPSVDPSRYPGRRHSDSGGGPLRLALAPGATPGSVVAASVESPALDAVPGVAGRDRELAELDRVLPTLEAGRSMTVVVTGEQGIGKTTLVEAVSDRLSGHGVEVVRARSMHTGAGHLWPWAQLVLAVIELLRSDGDFEVTLDLHPLAALGPSVAGALGLHPAPLLDDGDAPIGRRPDSEVVIDPTEPSSDDVTDDRFSGDPTADDSSADGPVPDDSELVDPASGDSADSSTGKDPASEEKGPERTAPDTGVAPVELAEVTMACVRLVDRLASRRPVALVLEDLQWADRATATALTFATRAVAERPVCFLLTWRNLDLGVESAAARLRELAGLPRLVRLDLGGIDASAVGRLAGDPGPELSAESVEIARRSGGNPLYIRELLSESEPGGADSTRSSLVDAVRDRVEQIHPAAEPVLTVGALLERPFSAATLEAVSGIDSPTIQEVLGMAVRSDVLVDHGLAVGTYRFRHPVVGETLVGQLLASERASLHRVAGNHLLASGYPVHEAARHLAESPDQEDRLSAVRLALHQLRHDFDGATILAIDRVVHAGFAVGGGSDSDHGSLETRWGPLLTKASTMAERATDPADRALGVEVLSYLSWRAWLDGRPSEWLEAGRQALDRALELHELVQPPARSRGTSAGLAEKTAPTLDSLDLLAGTALNLVGCPTLPTGPTRTMAFIPLPDSVVDMLKTVVDVLGDHSARPVLQVHLGHRESLSRLGSGARGRAVRDANKHVTSARRRLGRSAAAEVQMAAIARYCDDMDPADCLEAIDAVEQVRSDVRFRIFATRYSYPALLELGKTYDAEQTVERLVNEVADRADRADPMHVAEARLLWIRHLLWTGQIDQASAELQVSLDAWTALGIEEPVPFIRQRRTVRLLRGVPLGFGHGPDSHDQLNADRVRAPERAMRLARLGDGKRAAECLESTIDLMYVRHLGLSDQALTAMAAAMLGHEKAALVVYELLVGYGDQPVVRSDGSVILGPASLYAGLAAEAAGRLEQAAAHVDDARRAVQRFGGSPASLELMIRLARPRRTAVIARSNRKVT